MDIHVLTIFPGMFPGVIDASIVGLARTRGVVAIHLHDLRDHTTDRHRSIDDRPFGGGPGMVFKPEPVFRAVEAIERTIPEGHATRRVLLTPQGERFAQPAAERLASADTLILICGHYEGFDERIRIGLRPDEISIGDYVLSGGEVPALVVIDAVTRLLPGALGDARSAPEDSFSRGGLDCPHYTRPVEFRGMRVPDVLRTGDHDRIEAWREMKARERTRERRPDLLGAKRATTTPHTTNGRRKP